MPSSFTIAFTLIAGTTVSIWLVKYNLGTSPSSIVLFIVHTRLLAPNLGCLAASSSLTSNPNAMNFSFKIGWIVDSFPVSESICTSSKTY